MAVHIEIIADTPSSSRAVVSGEAKEVISDDEVLTFRLHEAALYPAIQKFISRDFPDSLKILAPRPTDAFLKSPTGWGDLYKRNNWPEVNRVMIPINAEILEVKTVPTIVKTTEHHNESSSDVQFNSGITESVSHSVASKWSQGHKFSVGQKINYKIKIGETGELGGETSFGYEYSWGSEETKTHTVTLGSSDGVRFVLKPGERRRVELSANSGTMKVRVKYRARLTGSIATHFRQKYKRHYFWAYPVAPVMSHSSILNSIEMTQDLTIAYYANAKITVKDLNGNVHQEYSSVNHAMGVSLEELEGNIPASTLKEWVLEEDESVAP